MKNRLNTNVWGALLVTLLMAAPPADTPVADAAQRGDVAAVRALLSQGADVDAAQGDGMSALHWAALGGNAELTQVLLAAGADAQAVTRLGGYAPIHLASKNGHVDALRALLESGADPTLPTELGATPLHFAAQSGQRSAVDVLIERGAQVDEREHAYDQTPLMWATASNRLDAIRSLLAAGADVSLTSKIIDYNEKSRVDGESRQERQRQVAARREAERAATEGDGEGEDANEEVVEGEEDAAAEQAAAAAAASAEDARRSAARRALEAARARRDAQQARQAQTAAQPSADSTADTQSGNPVDQDEDGDTVQARQLAPAGFSSLVGIEGGLTALHFASRGGFYEAADLLLEAGADVDGVTAGDGTSPLLLATINGHYDLGMHYLELGADPNLVSEDGVGPLFATLNNRWAPKALYPHPTAFKQQDAGYLDYMAALIEAGADVNARTERHVWYASFNFDLLGVQFQGATPFWRAAYALDVNAMKLLVAHGADPSLATVKGPERRRRRSNDDDGEEDPSGLEPVAQGGPAVYPIHAASGVGHGEGFAGNAHRHVPDGWVPAVKYLVEEHGADVNARDLNGYSPVHHAAARGDNDLILYLVSQGADVTFVSRRGQTTVDMANGPVQRIQPYPETITLLESLGAINNNNCLTC